MLPATSTQIRCYERCNAWVVLRVRSAVIVLTTTSRCDSLLTIPPSPEQQRADIKHPEQQHYLYLCQPKFARSSQCFRSPNLATLNYHFPNRCDTHTIKGSSRQPSSKSPLLTLLEKLSQLLLGSCRSRRLKQWDPAHAFMHLSISVVVVGV